MRTNSTLGKKKLLALLLSVMMVSSAGAAFAACGDNSPSSDSSSSSSTETTTQKDTGVIKNSNFQIFDTNNGKNLIGTSASGWTRSVDSTTSGSALSSKSASGIINTADKNWKALTESTLTDGLKPNALTEAQAKANWSKMSAKDKLEYYKAWEDNNKDKNKDVDDLDFYESFNIDAEDLPTTANPRTHDWKEGEESKDTNVLMIHNEYSSGVYNDFGTAQKFTSSSTVTVPAGSNATFSVWVKTADLTSSSSSGASQEAVDKGAYIRITHTLGGTTLEPLEIKNINTAGVEDNNGWVKYSFFLESSSFVDSTFTVVLGLGQGGSSNRSEFVNGYAFFDDITCTLDSETFATDKTNAAPQEFKHTATKEQKVLDYTKTSGKAFALNFSETASSEDWDVLTDTANTWEFAPTTEERSGNKYTAAANVANVKTYAGLGINKENDKTGVYTLSELNAEAEGSYLKILHDKNFKDSKFLNGLGQTDPSMLLMFSANGAAWTATSTQTTEYKLAADSYMAISFFVKTSGMSGLTGAGVTLTDGTAKTSISSIDTTTTEKENDDGSIVNDGWQKCFFFISNGTSEELSFDLSFTFGPTTVVDTTMSSYRPGFAAFTDFEIYNFGTDSTAYDFAKDSTYTKLVTLLGQDDEAAGDSGFDTPANVPTDAIKKGFANPKNYKGVFADSDYVIANGNGSNAEINQHMNPDNGLVAGLLSKEYLTIDEQDNTDYLNALGKLNATGATTADRWNALFGNETSQPLVIYNEKQQTKPYGFIGKSTDIAANSYATVSLRVKTNATAYVYLIDMDDETHQSTLSVNRNRTYWYDDEGNICVSDPSDKDFNPKKDVAFKLQANGLYKADANWLKENSGAADANKYYANLSVYTEKDKDGNLLTAKNGTTYDYNDKWNGYGKDGIAFYAKDGKYYANDKRLAADEVLDLATVTALPTRYDALTEANKPSTFFKVEDTNGEWATVTFQIRAGDSAKKYRLEVWNGDRQTQKLDTGSEAVGSYVFFDAYNPGAVDSKFATLIEQRQEEIDVDESLGNYFEGVFSFYDTDKFLRYDETADEKAVGNAYESYLPSSYTDGVAYLTYTKANVYEMYLDYTLSETAVTADIDDDDTTDNETDTAPVEGADPFLLAGSIIIAAVLLFAVISVIVRKIILKNRRNRNA